MGLDEQVARDGGASVPRPLVIRRTVPQDVVDVAAPLIGIALGTLIGRLLVGLPLTVEVVVATLAGAATVVVPIRVVTRVYALELHPGGLRIVRHLWFRDLLWWQVTGTLVDERRLGGRRFLLWGPAGRITMPFPYDSRRPAADPDFEEKVATIRAWWVAGLREVGAPVPAELIGTCSWPMAPAFRTPAPYGPPGSLPPPGYRPPRPSVGATAHVPPRPPLPRASDAYPPAPPTG